MRLLSALRTDPSAQPLFEMKCGPLRTQEGETEQFRESAPEENTRSYQGGDRGPGRPEKKNKNTTPRTHLT